MNRHSVYPSFIPTRPRGRAVKRFMRWLALFLVLVGVVLGTIYVIHLLRITEAQRELIFMQGMQAGFSMCGVGV